MLRVIAGINGGQKLKTLRGRDTRPTADRVREALFNVLSTRIIGCQFLDLFAGTGAIGIEALSRGAERVIFIESNPAAVRIIQDNLTIVEKQEQAEVLRRKLPEGLAAVAAQGLKFDIIFLDPPYWKQMTENTLANLVHLNLVTPEGWVVVESAAKEPLPSVIQGRLETFKDKHYGDTRLRYFRWMS
ncbi:MAG: 16S rRNA (guanine(966)-N(2))-methyltransferase RsmD [Bacillota bacterium]|jgi:16S rRNA (guanine966-N2)-methyltransferase